MLVFKQLKSIYIKHHCIYYNISYFSKTPLRIMFCPRSTSVHHPRPLPGRNRSGTVAIHNQDQLTRQRTPLLSCQSSGTDGCRTKIFFFFFGAGGQVNSNSGYTTGAEKRKGTAPRHRPTATPAFVAVLQQLKPGAAAWSRFIRTASGRTEGWSGFQAFLLVPSRPAGQQLLSSLLATFLCRILVD